MPQPKTSTTLQQLASKANQYAKFESNEKLTWCTGCGNFGIQNAIKRALTLEDIGLRDVLLCFDVGCNGNGADKINGYTFHGLHGRVVSAASGAVIANPKMKVIAMAGDGATFSEGVNHLVHAIRNNYPFLFIIHNNNNYGLTTGQASATTRKGQVMNGSADGVTTEPLNPLEMVLSLGPTFVARSFSGNVEHMTDMIRAGVNHNGFAVLEIMQSCPTYNKATPQEWYWDRLHYLDEKNHDTSDIWAARKAAEDLDNKIAVGILYKRNELNFLERLASREGKKTVLVDEVKAFDIAKLMGQFE
jgi:2-oxoglutarate ferredoxin oxidoreductase subunit beta